MRPYTVGSLAAVVVGITACARGPELDTRTYELQYLEAEVAAELIDPYVYGDRPDGPGRLSVAANLITVRETPDNLDKIARVIAEHDTPAPMVRLQFQVIEADGAGAPDPAIADIESALKELFRFRGYRLLTQAVMSGISGSTMTQELAGAGRRFGVQAAIISVRGVPDSASVQLHVRFWPEGGSSFETIVKVRAGKTVVLGSTRPDPDKAALIITVSPEVVTP